MPNSNSWSAQFRSRLRPLQALVHDAVDATTYLVEEGQDSTARAVVTGIGLAAPSLQEPAEKADKLRQLGSSGVLASVRLVNRTVQAASDIAFAAGGFEEHDEPAHPLRGDTLVSGGGAADQVVGVLNGFVGDHLADSGNGLDLGLRMRHGDQWLDLSAPLELSGATNRVVVLVHGLATTEISWSLGAEANGSPDAHLGKLLFDELAYTPIFVRYNTGRAIGDNGETLSMALEQLLAQWPTEVQQLVLVGHSMGGLVSRSATHHARRTQRAWLERLTHVSCIGSPHHGAPLARLGVKATEMLGKVDLPTTRIAHRILDRRSQGVKDLHCREQAAAGPLLDDVDYLFVASNLAGSPNGTLAEILGDMLVPVSSASGPAHHRVRVHRTQGIAHHQIQAHPDVVRQVLAFLDDDPVTPEDAQEVAGHLLTVSDDSA